VVEVDVWEMMSHTDDMGFKQDV